MDQRHTFADAYELFAFVVALQKDAATVSLLIDTDGLERLEGIITNIAPNDDMNNAFITIDSKQAVMVTNIIAVNGVFRADYSEC